MLEINVNDEIFTADGFSKAVKIIRKAILKWFRSNDQKPLIISLKKIEDRGPPALGINVNDGIGASGGLA